MRLASKDYDQISIAELARGAKCSVGAFYGRFKDKDAFLQILVASSFGRLTEEAKRDLNSVRWHDSSAAIIVEGVARHIATQMSQPRTAGVTRAALKLSMTNTDALISFLKYRACVADRAVDLLLPKLRSRDAAGSVQIAVQMIFSIMTDAILQDAGPLHAGSRRMIQSLSALMAGYLNLPVERYSIVDDSDDEAKKGPRSRAPSPRGTSSDDADSHARRTVSYSESSLGKTQPRRPSRQPLRGRDHKESVSQPLPVHDAQEMKPTEPREPGKKRGGRGGNRKRRLRLI